MTVRILAPHRSVASSRKDCYQSNRASVGSSRRHVSRSEVTTVCPACLIGPCEGSLRTVIAVGTSPTAQLEELHPQRIWYFYSFSGYPPPSPTLVAMDRDSMNGDFFGDCCRKGYFYVIVSSLCPWLLSTRGPRLMGALYSVVVVINGGDGSLPLAQTPCRRRASPS